MRVSDEALKHRQADAVWRGALMLDYVSQRIADHGLAVHPGARRLAISGAHALRECAPDFQTPVCPSHGVTHIRDVLDTGTQDLALMATNRAGYWLAFSLVEQRKHGFARPGDTRQILKALAFQLRTTAGTFPNPRYPQIRQEFVSMLACELASLACWRCGQVTHHADDVADTFCPGCKLRELERKPE